MMNRQSKALRKRAENAWLYRRSFLTGRLALAAAAQNHPDLILLDIDMPEMNGYEVCERLKSNQERD